jgi:hypothetical protein
MDLLYLPIQKRDGTWAELSQDHPVPVWIINPMQPKTIQVSVDERGDVVVTNFSDLDAVVQPLLERSRELGIAISSIDQTLTTGFEAVSSVANEGRAEVERIHAEYAFQIDRLNVYAKWLFIVLGTIALFSLAALIVAIVR